MCIYGKHYMHNFLELSKIAENRIFANIISSTGESRFEEFSWLIGEK